MKNGLNLKTLFRHSYWKPLTAIVFWSYSFIATKAALTEISPAAIVCIRQFFGIAFLALIAHRQKTSLKVTVKDLRWIVLLGVITGLQLWIQVTGLQWTSTSNTGWIIGFTPVFMIILSYIIFREKITFQQFIGIVISFGGLLLLVSKGDLTKIDLIKNKGDVLIVLSSFTWAVYSIISKMATLKLSPLTVTFYLLITMALTTAPMILNGTDLNAVINLSLKGWMAIIFLGIFCSGMGYYLWARTLNEMTASKAGAFLYLEPPTIFLFSLLFMNEDITIVTFLSGIIIIFGVILVNRK